MLPFPAIHLLAFLYFGACMETITVQQAFNLAVRPAGSKEQILKILKTIES